MQLPPSFSVTYSLIELSEVGKWSRKKSFLGELYVSLSVDCDDGWSLGAVSFCSIWVVAVCSLVGQGAGRWGLSDVYGHLCSLCLERRFPPFLVVVLVFLLRRVLVVSTSLLLGYRRTLLLSHLCV